MSERAGGILVPFVTFHIKRLDPGLLTLVVSKPLLEKRRARAAAKGEFLSQEDVAMGLARDLRGAEVENPNFQASSTPDGTLAVLSPSFGGYVVSDIVLTNDYLAGAAVYLPEEAESVEGCPRLIDDVVVVDAVQWNEGRGVRA